MKESHRTGTQKATSAWTRCIGELALDLKVAPYFSNSEDILILGIDVLMIVIFRRKALLCC